MRHDPILMKTNCNTKPITTYSTVQHCAEKITHFCLKSIGFTQEHTLASSYLCNAGHQALADIRTKTKRVTPAYE